MARRSLQGKPAAPNPTMLPEKRQTTVGATSPLNRLVGQPPYIMIPESIASAEKTTLVGAQAHDPPLWRFVFFLFNGRQGQWWSLILIAVSLVLLLLATIATALTMIAIMLPGGPWISGIIGSMIGGTSLWWHRRNIKSN